MRLPVYDNTVFKPGDIGIIDGLPMDVYRGAPGLAGSDLEIIARSPAEFNRGRREKPTEEMGFGTLFHDRLLHGACAYRVPPVTYSAAASQKKDAPMIDKPWNWNATVCKEWRDAEPAVPILDRTGKHSVAWLDAMVAKAMAHPLAADLLTRGQPEVSVFANHEDGGTLIKGRMDRLILDGDGAIIVEVKTTIDASARAFSREIWKRGYYRKAAWYRKLLHNMRRSPLEYWFVAVEKGDTPRVNVKQLAERAMDKGDFDNDDAYQIYRNCKLSGTWPDFPEAAQGVSDNFIDLPDFAYDAKLSALTGLTEANDGEAA